MNPFLKYNQSVLQSLRIAHKKNSHRFRLLDFSYVDVFFPTGLPECFLLKMMMMDVGYGENMLKRKVYTGGDVCKNKFKKILIFLNRGKAMKRKHKQN